MSYAGVTVGALLTVELILLGLAAILISILINSGTLPVQLIEATSESYTPGLRSFLQREPPDQEGISEWLDRAGAVTSTSLPLSFDVNEELLVVGSDGALLGALPAGRGQIGQPLDYQAIPGLTDPFLAALAGEEDSERLYALVRPENEVILAIPVWDAAHEDVLGVLVALGEIPTLRSYLGDLAWIIGISLLLFTVVAGLIGTAYGYLAARGPVRRLNRLSEATGAWSQGDFNVVVDDPAPDELGHLAQRLNQMARQLEQLLDTRRELAVVEERNRLARDLHDSAKQQAFAAAAQVSAAKAYMQNDPGIAESHIEEAERLIDDLRQELTSLIQELRPAALENKGLALVIRDYAADWSRQNGIPAEVIVRRERLLPLEIEQSLYRIMQETLANVARHSEAGQVEISLLYDKREITLTVSDDGQGYGVEDTGQGFGLRSMQERAQSVGGRLTVKTVLQKGTTVSCTLPAGKDVKNGPEEAHG